MIKLRKERGAAAVEFAIVSSVLFLVLFGAIQFGITFNRLQGLHAAAREGARVASLSQSTVQEIVDRVRNSVSIIDGQALAVGCPAALAVDEGCIDITPSGASDFQPCNLRSGETVQVAVRYKTLIQVPLWASPEVTMVGEGDFTCE